MPSPVESSVAVPPAGRSTESLLVRFTQPSTPGAQFRFCPITGLLHKWGSLVVYVNWIT